MDLRRNISPMATLNKFIVHEGHMIFYGEVITDDTWLSCFEKFLYLNERSKTCDIKIYSIQEI